jgi:regulator of sirC expression with transglutaminase-like and TPR domain
MANVRKRLESFAQLPDHQIDVAEAALVIAQEEYPELNIGSYLARLDDLAAAAKQKIPADAPVEEKIRRLNHFLFSERGFAGNHDNYYDPRNSFLNCVLDRRTGIPITLSVVYCELAGRLDLDIRGVSFPGHFLVRHVREPEVIIDPFFGTIISEEECERRLKAVYGRDMPLDRRMLEPATPRQILVRILNNLKQIYKDRDDFHRALRYAEEILLLTPDAPREILERGLIYQRLECFASALRDVERYLQIAPDDDTAATIRAALPELRRQAALLH